MLSEEQTLLIVIDAQEKLVEVMDKKEQLVQNIQTIIKGAKVLDIPIISIEQYPKGLGSTVSEIKECISDNNPIEKDTFSCCQNNQFITTLESYNRKQILVAGVEAHICVYLTAIELIEHGYEVEVITDAISSRTEYNKKIAIEKMISKGIGITTVEMVLFELLKLAKGDIFKQVMKIIK